MGCREAIYVDESTIDFPIFFPFFNTKFPIFPIFSIPSFLFSYFFERLCRWTPWMKHRRESTPVSVAFSRSTFWGERVSVHRFHPSYTVSFFVIDLFLTLITTFHVEIWPISCLNERKLRNRKRKLLSCVPILDKTWNKVTQCYKEQNST